MQLTEPPRRSEPCSLLVGTARNEQIIPTGRQEPDLFQIVSLQFWDVGDWFLQIPPSLDEKTILVQGNSVNSITFKTNFLGNIILEDISVSIVDSEGCVNASMIKIVRAGFTDVNCIAGGEFSLNLLTQKNVKVSGKRISVMENATEFLMTEDFLITKFEEIRKTFQAGQSSEFYFLDNHVDVYLLGKPKSMDITFNLTSPSMNLSSIVSTACDFIFVSSVRLILKTQVHHYHLRSSGEFILSGGLGEFVVDTVSFIDSCRIIGSNTVLKIERMNLFSNQNITAEIPIEAKTLSLNSFNEFVNFSRGITIETLTLSNTSYSNVESLNASSSLRIVVEYAMTLVPLVRMQQTNISEARVEMVYVGNEDEILFMERWNSLFVEIVCAPDLRCWNWSTVWLSKEFAASRYFRMVCSESVLFAGTTCFSLAMKEAVAGISPMTGMPFVATGFIFSGLLLAIVVVVAGVLYVRRRKERVLISEWAHISEIETPFS
jgi:hypothetical protein